MQTDREDKRILLRVNRWLDTMVIGLKLCPFASQAKRSGLVDIQVCHAAGVEGCLQKLIIEADRLREEDCMRTVLLVLAAGFEDFDEYLDLHAIAEQLLSDSGFDGVVQLASFHPDYCFAGVPAEDPGNWTNRAPYPILHLLTENSVSEAVDSHPDPESIPQGNIERLQQLGCDGIECLMAELMAE